MKAEIGIHIQLLWSIFTVINVIHLLFGHNPNLLPAFLDLFSYHSHLRAGGYREGAEACWLATIADDERPTIKEHPVKMLFTLSVFFVELAQFYSS